MESAGGLRAELREISKTREQQPGDNAEKPMCFSCLLEGGDLPSKSLRFLFRNGGGTNRDSHI